REKERVRENRAAVGEISCSFMAAEGEIPMVVDVQLKRRKSIFWIVRSSLVGNQKTAHRPDHSTGSRE
ncbi:hypothetical protein PanWU01x14_343560, partial [Parasponia andersonii]